MVSLIRDLASSLLSGDRRALSKAITLIESTLFDHRHQVSELFSIIYPYLPNSTFRIGISGPPGAGKSTFIEQFGMYLLSKNHRVAALVVDPSSPTSGGSLLADKTRMTELSAHQDAYVRPSSNSGEMGGLNIHTSEAITLCEASGYNRILVETVGVGQSEFAVADAVDAFFLLLPPASGDQFQGMKKGIVEMADLIIVNKADGDLLPSAMRTRDDYTHALHLSALSSSIWAPKVIACSSLSQNEGIDSVYSLSQDFYSIMTNTEELWKRRSKQRKRIWRHMLRSDLISHVLNSEIDLIDTLEKKLGANQIPPRLAVDTLLKKYIS